MISHTLRRRFSFLLIGSALAWTVGNTASAQDDFLQSTSIIREIQAANERQEMTVNTSRILTLSPSLTEANRIPRAMVNDEAVLSLTALSDTQIQIAAKKPGVTQVNVWDENGSVYTVDVIVYGDARELSMLLQAQFPNAALKVVPISNGVLISGYVDQPGDIQNILRIAEEYYPDKVLNNIHVGGVHQVLLHVRAMEVSRTKLRSLGFDWTVMSNGDLFVQGVSGLIGGITKGAADTVPGVSANSGATMKFDLINGNSAFFGVLEALRQDNLAKILAEPTLVTTSGRPAFFQVGGEVPYLVPQGLGTTAIEYKEYGTRVDFVPIVLGNGKIRLEVRPRVSEIDAARSIVSDGQVIYAFTKHEVDTGVQMQSGQTLAIAGLVQTRVESQRRGVPWVSDLPYIGAAFRRLEEKNNEIELLIFVTPELVDAMDAHEVPPCGPGMRTASPNDCELYLKGYTEVPRCCPPGGPGMIQGQPGPMFIPGQAPSPDQILAPIPSVPSAPIPPAPASSSVSTTRQDRSLRQSRPAADIRQARTGELPGFMGAIGYETAE
ncbi:MAG: pilus assembly protein N-terminal domain-containing protein [Planctomycetes bacterium]|nr:pilus assembly protein N-terminal domain-containing protein [Planctomycetota bacterium]